MGEACGQKRSHGGVALHPNADVHHRRTTESGGRPRTCSGPESMVTSAISTNSRFKIHFVILDDRDAAGLKGPFEANEEGRV